MVGLAAGTILRHTVQLTFTFQRRSPFLQVIHVTVVHADNQVELIKVICTHRTRAMRQQIPPSGRMYPHPAVRHFPLMIRQNTGRINLIRTCFAGLFYQMPHHSFRTRGTADISQTYKQYSLFLHHLFINTSALFMQLQCRIKDSIKNRVNDALLHTIFF